MKHMAGHHRDFVKVEISNPTGTRHYSTSSGRDCNSTLPLNPPNPSACRTVDYLPAIWRAKNENAS